ncbi:elongin complex protein [Malassezia pachydermatis]
MHEELPLLSALCRRVIFRHIHALYDVGEMPYRLAKPFLQQCRPDQLRAIEAASPHLLEDTEELWHRACVRDFSDVRKAEEEGTLSTPTSWRDMYAMKQQQVDEARAQARERIKGRYAEHSAQKDAKRVLVANVPMPTKRRRMIPSAGPLTPLQSKGQAMLAKARTGLAMRTRQMMRPPRPSLVRAAPSVTRPPARSESTSSSHRPAGPYPSSDPTSPTRRIPARDMRGPTARW